MPLTKEQLAKIAQKEATLSAALKRSTSTNYYEGYFFITLNTRDYAPILSYISGRPDAPEGTPNAPRCEYTELGRKVMAVWQTVPSFHPHVEIIAAEAMPDHFHGLLRLKAGNRKHLGRMVNGFMIACTHEYWDTVDIKWRDMKKDPNKSDRDASRDWYDRDHTHSFRGPSLFVRGYNDMEAVTPEQVQTKLQYIREQARRAIIKGTLLDRFLIHRSCTAHGWTLEAIRRGLFSDCFYAHNPERFEATLLDLMPRILMHPAASASASGPCPASASVPKPLLSYIGCSALLSAERKLPLVCHRSDAPFFERQRDAVLCAAREGAVIVSAFISPREREIRRLLLIEQLPMIEVYDNGFADRYKPSGKKFYACAENRLVQISPWNYEYSRNLTVNRAACLVMNELARVIAGTGEGWWKGIDL